MSVLGKTIAAIRHPILVFRLWRKARAMRPCRHKWGPQVGLVTRGEFARKCRRCGNVKYEDVNTLMRDLRLLED